MIYGVGGMGGALLFVYLVQGQTDMYQIRRPLGVIRRVGLNVSLLTPPVILPLGVRTLSFCAPLPMSKFVSPVSNDILTYLCLQNPSLNFNPFSNH